MMAIEKENTEERLHPVTGMVVGAETTDWLK